MSSLRSFIRTLAIATACAFIAAPLAASAEEKPSKSPRVEKVEKKRHDKGDFPMKPEKFSEIVDRRIDVARAQMEFIITAQSLPEGVKAQVRRDFDAAAAKIRTTAKEAGKDGKVTKEEAKDVRQDARTLVKDLRAKYGKDKKPAKDA